MSQCVPNWDLDDGLPHHPTTNTAIHAPMAEYVVSELTWEKGHLARHGFHGGPLPRVAQKRPSPGAPSWEKAPLANGTLEAVVDQATRAPVPAVADALVPSSKIQPDAGEPEHQPGRAVRSSFAGGGSGRCGGSGGGRKRPRPPGAGDGSRSATGSAPSVGLAFDACEINGEEAGFATSASAAEGSPETENASYARTLTAVSEGDDSCYSRDSPDGSDEEEKSKNEKGRSSASTKRIRAAAVHNQSERKRRDRINQRMRTLQKLVPNSSKTDKASILDEVIDYMKQLQAQVQVMSRMSSMPHMMMPMAMQQLQMAMMTQMAQMAQMGMAMGMGAMADIGQSGMPWPPFLPPSASRVDVPARDPMQAPAGALPLDPFAAFMAFQGQQPMNMEAQSRMAALYQQQHHQQPPGPSNET